MPFSNAEHALLLRTKGVGPTVVKRLEQMGFHSLSAVAQADAQALLEGGAHLTGSTCWKNSPQARAAMEAVIALARQQPHSPPCNDQRSDAAPSIAPALATLPGLGPKSAQVLAQAAIDHIAQLQQLGAVEAYLRVQRSGQRPSLNLLWALEGALTGESWQAVAKTERTRLLMMLDEASSRVTETKLSPLRRM